MHYPKESTPTDLDREVSLKELRKIILCGVGMTATVTPEGNLNKVGEIKEKLAALKDRDIVILAEDQKDVPPEYLVENAKPKILKAPTIEGAVRQINTWQRRKIWERVFFWLCVLAVLILVSISCIFIFNYFFTSKKTLSIPAPPCTWRSTGPPTKNEIPQSQRRLQSLAVLSLAPCHGSQHSTFTQGLHQLLTGFLSDAATGNSNIGIYNSARLRWGWADLALPNREDFPPEYLDVLVARTLGVDTMVYGEFYESVAVGDVDTTLDLYIGLLNHLFRWPVPAELR